MSTESFHCTCVANAPKPTRQAVQKVKSLIKNLLPRKSRRVISPPRPLCPGCKAVLDRYSPLFRHPVEFEESSSSSPKPHKESRSSSPTPHEESTISSPTPPPPTAEYRRIDEITRYIWGGKADDSSLAEEIIAYQVYELLRVQNSPVLEYLDRKDDAGCDLADLPKDVRRDFERVIETVLKVEDE
ncbi:hypothetical protein GGS24DRAFT_70053 [Hypoxylon argillaceum]|nr:hypothetical protein GGS24DRAFT_70053 [Hypoxylon argillaceum]